MDKKGKVFIGRRFGASPEARERMDKHDAEQTWHATCPRCDEKVKGSLAELREHRCAVRQ